MFARYQINTLVFNVLTPCNYMTTLYTQLAGAVLALARWRANGGAIPAGGQGAQYAAELRTLLVYLSESLGRLGQNEERGVLGGGTFFIGGRDTPPIEPLLAFISHSDTLTLT